MATRSILHVRRRPRPLYLRYAVACAAVAVTVLAHVFLTPYLGVPNVSLLIAVVVSSWFGGIGTGIFATVLSAAAGWYLIPKPHILNTEALVVTVLYLG